MALDLVKWIFQSEVDGATDPNLVSSWCMDLAVKGKIEFPNALCSTVCGKVENLSGPSGNSLGP